MDFIRDLKGEEIFGTFYERDFSNYATKAGFKNRAGVDMSDFAKKADLAN